jgi:type IV secretory pathway TraG/TraD family ATPase VirD4
MNSSDLETTQSSLLTEIGQLLETDIFDKPLPTISFTEYIEEPVGTVIIDNRNKDYTAPLWRFTINRAIELSMTKQYPCRFVLDEFDELPHISKLKKLASAGRSSDSLGILACQDVNQLESVYPDLGGSIWSNSPNRAAFRCGNASTAELVLSSIGESEVVTQSRSETDDSNDTISRSMTDSYPLTTGEIEGLKPGESLIQSKNGWWLADLTEVDV